MAWTGALAEVFAVLEAQRAAWNAGDLSTFMTGYEPHCPTFVSPKGVRRGYAQIAADYQEAAAARARRTDGDGAEPAGGPALGTLSFSDLELRDIVPDLAALAIGRFHLVPAAAASEEATGWFSLVLRRNETGSWCIIHDHTS